MDDARNDTWMRIHGWIIRAPLWLRAACGWLVVYSAFYFLLDANALRYPYLLTPAHNSNVAEAAAILDGHLVLETATRDTAVVDGKAYNVYPPAFTLVSLAVLPWCPEGVPLQVVLVLAIPLPALAYLLFRRRTEKVCVATALTLCYLFGTSMLPVLNRALGQGDVYHVNHVLAQLGLLVFLLDYFGARRVWVGGIGLLIAAWSRQLCGFYLLPLAVCAALARSDAVRRRHVLVAAVFAAAMLALPLTLNGLKFGNPLDSGYAHIYEGKDSPPAEACREFGLFSPRYVPRNLYHMNVGLPGTETISRVMRFKPDDYGTGIWWTTPVLLYLLVDWRRAWGPVETRALLAAAALAVLVLLLYHTTGWLQPGYNRFSLDYMAVVLAVIAPGCDGFRRRWLTPVLVAWSVWYFRWGI